MHGYVFASMKPINRCDVLDAIVPKLCHGFQCCLYAIEGSRWKRFVVLILEDHDISP